MNLKTGSHFFLSVHRLVVNSFFLFFYTQFPLSSLCLLFKVEYRHNLLKRFYQPNYSFPKSRDNINREFPLELRWWQRYLEVLIISTK